MSLRVIWQYMDRSIYCHMTLSAMNYLLYMMIFLYSETYLTEHEKKPESCIKSYFM
jgi:hypothetical protein